MVNILVIVDSEKRDSGRTNFWEWATQNIGDINCKEVSLPERTASQQKITFDDEVDILVINWDVADGDPVFESDKAQTMLKRYDNFKSYVKHGGILVVECQSSHYKIQQNCYDLILGEGEVEVKKISPSNKAYINEKEKEHQVLKDLPLEMPLPVEYNQRVPSGTPWYPKPESVSKDIYDNIPKDKLYLGAFVSHKPEWVRLLLTEDKRYPIMLAKTLETGMYIATSMLLSATAPKQLIENIIKLKSSRAWDNVRQYHENHNKNVQSKRRWKWRGFVVITVVLALGVMKIRDTYSSIDAYMGGFIRFVLTGFVSAGVVVWAGKVVEQKWSIKRGTRHFLNLLMRYFKRKS